MTVVFARWLHWKQGQKNSRRHLIFERCILLYGRVLWLKEEFLTATSPVNYLVSFVAYKRCTKISSGLLNGKNLCLENAGTGERLSVFEYAKGENRTLRIWRRISFQDDNQKNLDAEQLSMLSGECSANENFDKNFYDF